MKNKTLLTLLICITLVAIPAGNANAYTQRGFDVVWLENELEPLIIKLSKITGIPENDVLEKVFGELHFWYDENPKAIYYCCWASLYCEGKIPFDDPELKGLLLHELGHRFLNLAIDKLGKTGTELSSYSIGYYEGGKYIHVSGINPETGMYQRTLRGLPHYKNSQTMTYKEDYADMFMHWALENFGDKDVYGLTTAGKLRMEYIDKFIKNTLNELGLYQTKKQTPANYPLTFQKKHVIMPS